MVTGFVILSGNSVKAQNTLIQPNILPAAYCSQENTMEAMWEFIKAGIMYVWQQASLGTTEMPSTPTLIHTFEEEMDFILLL